ncbi:MAG: sigma-70 family RNA polymerase sigma factor [Lachnospiraceae bacterium]|nr:sigma-70 family RNA polymerase sigma factor [Lachnospiraceae bacterium]
MTAEKVLDSLTDEDLAALSAQGQPEAADCLMQRYKGYVRSLSHARYLIGGDTDDLIQEGMIGLMKAIRDYRPDKGAAFRTFATLCIVRQQANAIETAAGVHNEPLNQSVQLTDEEWERAFIYMRSSPEDIVLGQEASDELRDRISHILSDFENQVLGLYLQDRNYREIARELGRTPKTVDNAIQRIKKKVRACFET